MYWYMVLQSSCVVNGLTGLVSWWPTDKTFGVGISEGLVSGKYIFNVHWPNRQGFCTVCEQPWVDLSPWPFTLKVTTLTTVPWRPHTWEGNLFLESCRLTSSSRLTCSCRKLQRPALCIVTHHWKNIDLSVQKCMFVKGRGGLARKLKYRFR